MACGTDKSWQTYPWHHGVLNRVEAETVLSAYSGTTWLVRTSVREKSKNVISVGKECITDRYVHDPTVPKTKSPPKVYSHYIIFQKDSGGYYLQLPTIFPTLDKLIEHYKQFPLGLHGKQLTTYDVIEPPLITGHHAIKREDGLEDILDLSGDDSEDNSSFKDAVEVETMIEKKEQVLCTTKPNIDILDIPDSMPDPTPILPCQPSTSEIVATSTTSDCFQDIMEVKMELTNVQNQLSKLMHKMDDIYFNVVKMQPIYLDAGKVPRKVEQPPPCTPPPPTPPPSTPPPTPPPSTPPPTPPRSTPPTGSTPPTTSVPETRDLTTPPTEIANSAMGIVETPQPGTTLKVISPYIAANFDELDLQVNDTIIFLVALEPGWWRGYCDSRIGVFPTWAVVLCTE